MGLRSLSALAGLALVPIVYLTALELGSRRAALMSALLIACNPLLVWYSQEARSYALLALLSAAALYCAVRAQRDPPRRWPLAWAVMSVLALATHYFAVFLLVPEGLWLLRRRRSRACLVLPLAAAVALLPLAVRQESLGHAAWIFQSPLAGRAAAIFPQLLIGIDADWAVPLGAVASAAALVGLWLLRGAPSGRHRAAAALTALGVGIPFALSLVGDDFLSTRNVIAVAAPFSILLASGFARSRAGPLAWIVVCAVGVAVVLTTAAEPKYHSEAWRAVARTLGATTERVIDAVPGQAGRKPLELYLPGSSELSPRGAAVTDVCLVALPRQGHETPLPLPPARALELLGFKPGRARDLGEFRLLGLHAPRRIRVTPVALGVSGGYGNAPVALVQGR